MTRGTIEAIRKIQECTTIAQLRTLWDNDLGRSGWLKSVRIAYIKRKRELGMNLSHK